MQRRPTPNTDWIADALGDGARVRRVARLAGATSSTLYAVDVVRNGRTLPLVLRRFTNAAWLAESPDLVQHEAAALAKAAQADLPTPTLVACDPAGEACGVPALLMTRLPGRVVVRPDDLGRWLHQLAEALVPLHDVPVGDFPWAYAPYNDVASLTVPAWSRHPTLWARAIEIVQGPWPEAPACFIHRDYHPTNVLWHRDRVSGVVDWPNACRGPAGIDVAWCRSNLAALCGVAAADRFQAAYRALAGSGFTYDPFWDLMVIIEGLPGPPDVYPPWIEYGARGLTPALMRVRQDAYLVSVMARVGA
jgi:aminoglycoside phosphotransferase (APT) family kinase protein